MATTTQSKQERVPVLFALGLVLVLAAIALALVAPNEQFTFRGAKVSGLASVGQLAQYSDDDYAKYMAGEGEPLMTGPNVNHELRSIWDGPMPTGYFDNLSPDFSDRSSTLDAYLDRGVGYGSYDPFASTYGDVSSLDRYENLYSNNSTSPVGDSGTESTDDDIAQEIGRAYTASLTGAPAPTDIVTTGRSSTNIYQTGSDGVTRQVVFSNANANVGANTGVNRAAQAQPTSCAGTKCQFENPLGTRNGTLETFLNSILDVIIMIGGIVVVISIILAGLKYVTAQGDEGKISDAHKQLTWTVIGAGILLGAKVIALVIQNTVKALT